MPPRTCNVFGAMVMNIVRAQNLYPQAVAGRFTGRWRGTDVELVIEKQNEFLWRVALYGGPGAQKQQPNPGVLCLARGKVWYPLEFETPLGRLVVAKAREPLFRLELENYHPIWQHEVAELLDKWADVLTRMGLPPQYGTTENWTKS